MRTPVARSYVVRFKHDRAGLERLCRYGGRPAFAGERLALTAGGQVSYRLKKPWPDGRTHLELSPVAFLRRLAGILPPPRRHLVRYAGVFASRARRRARVVALAPGNRADADAVVIAPSQSTDSTSPAVPTPTPPGRRAQARLPWAELLQRVFAEDVLACPCGGRRRVLAFITDLHVASDILAALGLPATIPTFATARAPPMDDWLGHSDPDMGDLIDNPRVDPASEPPAWSNDELSDRIGDPAPDDFADPPSWDESDSP